MIKTNLPKMTDFPRGPPQTYQDLRGLFESVHVSSFGPNQAPFHYQTVHKHSDLEYPNFYVSPLGAALFKYAYDHTYFPSPLKDKPNLTGTGIFLFAGNSQVQNQGFAKEHYCVLKRSPAFLYVKYYAHIDEQREHRQGVPKIYVSPTINSESEKNQISFLEITAEFEWIEAIIEIDVRTAIHGRYGVKFGTMNFDYGDYFLVDKIGLIYGKVSPSLEQMQDLFEQKSELELTSNSASTQDASREATENPINNCFFCTCWKYILFPFKYLLNIILWPFEKCWGIFHPEEEPNLGRNIA